MQVSWQTLAQEVASCQKCALCAGRTHTVLGCGDYHARVMFIGEGPGRVEDETGIPFTGAAGHLLDELLLGAGLRRDEVYIANIVKCRPPQNRDPLPEEQQACLPYLRAQVGLIRPKILVCLGRVAGKALLDPNLAITRQRGQWIKRKAFWMMATYHPAALLRDADKLPDARRDFEAIREKLISVAQEDGA
nr:uracil-DNA glycosylase [bacterium]